MSAATFVRGDRVRILTGMAGGRVGTVVSAHRGLAPVVNVEVEIPVLLSDPDGPTRVVQMPYEPDELEAVEPEPVPALADEQVEDVAVIPEGKAPLLVPGQEFVTLSVAGFPRAHFVCDAGHVHDIPPEALTPEQRSILDAMSRGAADARDAATRDGAR